MNVLITGIDGFVGSHLAETLLATPGHKLYGTVRNGSLSPAHNKGIERIQVDITSAADVIAAIRKAAPEKIFHLAGQAFVPTSFENPSATFQSNFQGTLNILEAVRQLQTTDGLSCSVLIVSSGEVYGSVPRERLPIDEQFPLRPENPYAVSKACADMIAQQYRASFGVDVVVARPFNHLGPRQSDLFVGSAFAKQVAEIKCGLKAKSMLVGNLEPMRDFTDVRDVVSAYLKLLEKKHRFSVFNICTEHAVSIRSLLDTLCDIAGIEVEIATDPLRLRANENPIVVGSSRRLREATGWAPNIPLRQTLEDLLAYWLKRLSRTS